MVSSAAVLEDSSLLSDLDRRFHTFEKILALISGFAVFSLMVLAVVSVGGRNTINHPLPGYVDWIEQLMPLIAFLGMSYTQRDGGHIRMDIVVGRLKGRALWIAEFITVFFMLALALLLLWGSGAHFLRSFDFAVPYWSNDSSIDINLPIWPAKLLAPVAFFVLTVRLSLQLWGYGRAITTNAESPVAVPLVRDAAAMAAEEADTVSGSDE